MNIVTLPIVTNPILYTGGRIGRMGEPPLLLYYLVLCPLFALSIISGLFAIGYSYTVITDKFDSLVGRIMIASMLFLLGVCMIGLGVFGFTL